MSLRRATRRAAASAQPPLTRPPLARIAVYVLDPIWTLGLAPTLRVTVLVSATRWQSDSSMIAALPADWSTHFWKRTTWCRC